MKLVINADDLGYSEERNVGIFEICKDIDPLGTVSNFSVLVNFDHSKIALEKWKNLATRSCGCGLHLNFTEGKPVSDPSLIPTLVTAEGVFKGKFGFGESLDREEVSLHDITQETRAQINLFKKYSGQNPSHVDGHNHYHIHPRIAGALADVFKHKGIFRTRIPFEAGLANSYPWMQGKQLEFLSQVTRYATAARTTYHERGIHTTDFFMGLGLMGANSTPERIREVFSKIAASNAASSSKVTVEWMVHPGRSQQVGGDDFSRSADREHEMKILRSPELHDILKEFNVKIVSWNDT
eukprot:TRINITY_DN5985_c0_g2_i1.p1 TRINITY_DN5985_c0_g2~~TRINITY_DN5985_c0_g2_i1.p1  ORF type:complete len:296 (-),score=51.93 TRINITY_DN5985_c0_g2_i1:38-925(-)